MESKEQGGLECGVLQGVGEVFPTFLPEQDHLGLKLWEQQSPAHPANCEGSPSQKSLVRDPGQSLLWDTDRSSGLPSLPVLQHHHGHC